MSYTPGLQISTRTRHRCRRVLPIAGEVLVNEGDVVAAEQTVARALLPGNAMPINLSNLLSLPPADVPAAMLVQEGNTIEVGDVIARTKGIFGWFKSEHKSRVAGTLEQVSSVTGQLIVRGDSIPVEVKAYLAGHIVEVIPSEGCIVEAETSLIQGIFGIGGEAYGPIRTACQRPDEVFGPDRLTPDMQGAIVIGGARMTGDTVRKAIEIGATAVVSGGIDDQDLRDILGYDLGVAVTGSEHIGISLIITEGFGNIAMAERTFKLLKSREGANAACNGATQIRAGVLRPEIVIPTPDDHSAAQDDEPHVEVGTLAPGVPVRIIRDPYFGILGTVADLPSQTQVLGSGSKARVLDVKCDSGETVTVPRANVEIIGG